MGGGGGGRGLNTFRSNFPHLLTCTTFASEFHFHFRVSFCFHSALNLKVLLKTTQGPILFGFVLPELVFQQLKALYGGIKVQLPLHTSRPQMVRGMAVAPRGSTTLGKLMGGNAVRRKWESRGSFGAGRAGVGSQWHQCVPGSYPLFYNPAIPFLSSELHLLYSWHGSEETHKLNRGKYKIFLLTFGRPPDSPPCTIGCSICSASAVV